MTRSVPHHLRRCSCGCGVSVSGPARTPNGHRVGAAQCWRDRQTPVPGTARAPLPMPFRGCGFLFLPAEKDPIFPDLDGLWLVARAP